MAARVQRLHLAMEGAVLSVQRVLVALFTRLDHFNCYLNITQCLESRKGRKKYINLII